MSQTLRYTYLDIDVKSVKPNSESSFDLEAYPEHQVVLRSLLDIGAAWELDTYLYYVDALKNSTVNSYPRIDLRLGWHCLHDWETSLILQNLFDDQHLEFIPAESTSGGGLVPTEVERSVLLNLKKYF